MLEGSAALALSVSVARAFDVSAQVAEQNAIPPEFASLLQKIRDPEIRAGVAAAITKNLIPAAVEEAYPGHFNISADGSGYGGWATWPGLDSWQMAGAYLLLGKTRIVLDYFEFVTASQRKDGNIPFAIFAGDTRPDGGFLSGLKFPDDLFTYKPPKREGLPASSQETRQWMRLFTHWQPKAEPLSTLGPVCYVLTAAEIYDVTRDKTWLKEHLPAVEATAKYLASRTTANGLVAHSGFYLELPPRYGWDGVAQCYVIHAYRELARLFGEAGDAARAESWGNEATKLAKAFVENFWREDHFGEYVHQERGLVDSHGLSDTNWAAVAFGIASDAQLKTLWPKLTKDEGFWWGGMPTLTVTKPFSYETWEYHEQVPMEISPVLDVASMGRVWYLEALACARMNAHERLIDSTRRVCAAAKADGFWRERYLPQPDKTSTPARSAKYCEYPAVLLRVVLGNRDVF